MRGIELDDPDIHEFTALWKEEFRISLTMSSTMTEVDPKI
jgi:hypothetical protein